MAFQKAERRRAKARILIEGPSGSGKSYGALLLAKGIGGRWAAIDTEHGSLSMYANLLDFDVMELSAPFSPKRYVEAIKEAEEAGYDGIIIDSITHEWSGEGGIMDILDKTPAPGGNSFGRWAVVTPLHNRFIEAMLQAGLHVIATTRSKTEWAIEEKKPVKLGTAPQQRDGIDYEFTVVFSVQTDNHVASVTKDRTAQFDGYLEKISAKTGKAIVDWLESGAEPAPAAAPEPEPPAEANGHADSAKELRNACRDKARELELTPERFAELIAQVGGEKASLNGFTASQANDLLTLLDAQKPAKSGKRSEVTV